MREFYDHWIRGDEWLVAGIAATFVLLTALMVAESINWAAFKAEHNCKIVGQMSGTSSTGVGFSSSGGVVPVTTYSSGKTGWLCDDGITYWR